MNVYEQAILPRREGASQTSCPKTGRRTGRLNFESEQAGPPAGSYCPDVWAPSAGGASPVKNGGNQPSEPQRTLATVYCETSWAVS